MVKSITLNGCSAALALGFPAMAAALFIGSVKQSNEAEGCPIVLDLNGNGYIDIMGHTTAREKVYSLFSIEKYVDFDIFDVGTPEPVDWIKGGRDAFLVDLSEGVPEGNLTGRHLFGTVGRSETGESLVFENGFEKLALLDTDSDRYLAGAELAGLALWKDDGDGQFTPDELIELTDVNVTRLPVSPSVEPGPYGSEVMSAFAETADGATIYMEDIWFMTPSDPLDEHRGIGRFLNMIGM